MYWVLGPAFVLYALACSVFEWRRGGRVLLGIGYLGAACVLVIGGGIWYRMQQPDLGYHFSWPQVGREWWQAIRPAALYATLLFLMIGWDWAVGRRWRRCSCGGVGPSVAGGRYWGSLWCVGQGCS